MEAVLKELDQDSIRRIKKAGVGASPSIFDSNNRKELCKNSLDTVETGQDLD